MRTPTARFSQVSDWAQEKVRGALAIWESGIVPFPRVDHGLRALHAVKRFGPFVGANQAAAVRDPNAVGIVDDRGSLTYHQLDAQSNALVRAFAARGVRPGSVMAAMCRDHRGLILTMLAAGKLGARLLLLNTGFAKPQLADVAARERVETLVYDDEFTDLLADIPASVSRYLAWLDKPKSGVDIPMLDELIRGVDDRPVRAPASPGGFVLLTSGTTGTPKGAPRPKVSFLDTAQFLDRIPWRAGECTYLAAPLFHGTGLSQFLLSFALGSKVVLHRGFDPVQTLRGIERHRCTGVVLVPTMLRRIVDLGPAELAKYDTSSLRIVFVAGSALSPDLGDRAMAAFGDVLYNLYGSTEVAVATVATPADWRRAPGTAGRVPVGCRVALYDDDGRPVTESGVVGRVFVGSALSFDGYTDGRTKETIDGLLATGDVGHFDADGLLFIDGRDDEMIVSGGENVFPNEVENLLVARADVVEAVVVGVPDEEFGQRLKAIVVPTDEARLDADTIRTYVKANLARYKVPRDVEFVTELPRNATGKVLRNQL